MNKEEIKKEAKQIMDNFMGALSDIEIEEEFSLKRDECYRKEKEGDKTDSDFQNRFLNNAPKSSGNAIVANKGEWTNKKE